MKLLRWVLGIVLLAAVIALVVVFWPTIVQATRRCLNRVGRSESDDLEEYPKAA